MCVAKTDAIAIDIDNDDDDNDDDDDDDDGNYVGLPDSSLVVLSQTAMYASKLFVIH